MKFQRWTRIHRWKSSQPQNFAKCGGLIGKSNNYFLVSVFEEIANHNRLWKKLLQYKCNKSIIRSEMFICSCKMFIKSFKILFWSQSYKNIYILAHNKWKKYVLVLWWLLIFQSGPSAITIPINLHHIKQGHKLFHWQTSKILVWTDVL